LTRAYDILSADEKRSEYDKTLTSHASRKPEEGQSAQECFARAEAAIFEKDFKNALYFLEESIRLAPDSPEKGVVYLRYGQVLSRVPGKLREAVDALRKSAILDSSKATPHVELGLAYGKTGLREKALAAFQEALRRDPDNKLARAELAILNAKK
jgi:tetratricopeptide (TPR) repeat protein